MRLRSPGAALVMRLASSSSGTESKLDLQVTQLAGLREGGLDDLGRGRAHVVRPGHRGAVDVLAALCVPDQRARGPGDDQAGLAAGDQPAEQRGPSGGQVFGGVGSAGTGGSSRRDYFGFCQR